MQFSRAEFTGMFARLVLSLMVAFAVCAGALEQKGYAADDLCASAQSGTHEIAFTCDSCSHEEPDDSDIDEALELIDETEEAVVRPTTCGQG